MPRTGRGTVSVRAGTATRATAGTHQALQPDLASSQLPGAAFLTVMGCVTAPSLTAVKAGESVHFYSF